MTFFTPHLPLREGTFNSCIIFDIEDQDGLKKYDEYSISCEATCCWCGASNQRAVFASESFSVYGQKSTSPSWILNAYQRWWQARGQKAAQVAAVSCSIRPQRPTEPLTAFPDPALSLKSTVCPLVLPFLFIISTHRQQRVEAQSAADWPPSFIGPDKEPPLQESKTHQKSQLEHAKPKNRVETQIKHAWISLPKLT